MKYIFTVLLVTWMLQACSSEPFKLRGTDDKNVSYLQEQVFISGASNSLRKELQQAFNSSGAQTVRTAKDASLILSVSGISEGKHAVGYSSTRKVREFDVYLKFNYNVKNQQGKMILPTDQIEISRTLLYDSEFALGKTAEEEQIRQNLRKEAATQILVRLRFAKGRALQNQ